MISMNFLKEIYPRDGQEAGHPLFPITFYNKVNNIVRKKHNLLLEYYAFEESLIDEVTESNPDNYITQIMIRVKDINNQN